MNSKIATGSASSTPGIPIAVWAPVLGVFIMIVLFVLGMMLGGRKI